MSILRYAVLGAWLCAIAYGGFQHLEAKSARSQLEGLKRANEISLQVSIRLLRIAHHEHDGELLDLARYRADNPIGPVRLCTQHAAVPARASPAAASGPGAEALQPVHAGDSGSGAAAAGPDISGMLDAIAASCDAVSADLREQQARR